MDNKTLADLVDVFRCCIFNFGVLTTMVPAFFLAGGIAALVPTAHVVKYLSARSPKVVSYSVAALSGFILSFCSCNIVPVFASVHKRGAGLGPAVTFLYAGPAINILSMIWVIRVAGAPMGFARAILVPLMAVAMGLWMVYLFRAKEAARQQELDAAAALAANPEEELKKGRLVAFFGILFAMIVIGGISAIPMTWRVAAVVALLAALGVVLAKHFTRVEILEWLRETWDLTKLVIPILIVVLLVLAVLTRFVSMTSFEWLAKANIFAVTGVSSAFGSLMYFPILTEVPFVRVLMKDVGMGAAPVLAILLTAPGLSLPGILILRKVVGWKKVLTYVVGLIILSTLVSIAFAAVGPALFGRWWVY